ncbi:MAG: GMC oxidoreductase [Parahaliea sp.]
MIIDLSTDICVVLPPIDCDVCIVGAGPAGISLALTLARIRPDWLVVLLEAGGIDSASERERDIYKVTQTGRRYPVMDISRRRMLGGSSAHWGGWSRPLDITDFEENPAWDQPGWPLSAADLAPYYVQASGWCELDDSNFDPDAVAVRHPKAMFDTVAFENIDNRLFRFSTPTRFGTRYRQALEEQKNLHCYLHANLLPVESDNERIEKVEFCSLGGGRYSLMTKQLVLAMGGMECTRYLLNMRRHDDDSGSGIYSYHLGRYFGDHFGLIPAQVLAPAELQYHLFSDDGSKVMPVLCWNDKSIRRDHHNNSAVRLYATAADPMPGTTYTQLPGLGFTSGDFWQYDAKMTIEPRPNPDSYLQLLDERCELGLRRLALHWVLDRGDFRSAFGLLEQLAQELGGSGLGRVRLTQTVDEAQESEVSAGCHHMGTIRMAADPRDGVSDPNLRVYGFDNLYIASSAVFPKFGFSNPTLTIVALALRLADHLGGGRI